MKKFVIINGMDLIHIECNDLSEAKQKAFKICDHSKEIIVRQIQFEFRSRTYNV